MTSPSSSAWTYSSRGLPQNILTLSSPPLPIPTLPPPLPLPRSIPNPEEWLLVRVAFVGLNPGAIFQMTLIPPFLRSPVCVPEMDLSGTVVDVWHPDGSSATPRFKKGDKVAAMLPAGYTVPTGSGALAEYVRVPARYAVAVPPGVKMGDAAGSLLPAMTAWELVKASRVEEGGRVLVNAAGGGIGTMVVQMARNVVGEGGYVVGICSGRNAELVKSLGADEVIDYTLHTSLPAHLKSLFSPSPFSAIIDTLGHQALYLASPSYLLPTGLYASVGIKPPTFFVPDFLRAVLQMKLNEWWPTSPWLGGVGRVWAAVAVMSPTLEDRQRVVDLLAEEKIRLVRDSVWPFEKAREAYAKLGGLHARGKVLVKVDSSLGHDE